MRIFLVDASATDRQRLVHQLSLLPGLCIAGEASGAAQASALIGWTRPDLILVALPLIEGTGLQMLGELRRRSDGCRIAVLMDAERAACAQACIAAGADACHDRAACMDALLAGLAQPASRTRAAATAGVPLLREGLRGLHGHAALCERLTQSARSAVHEEGASLAVYVMRMSAQRSLPRVQAELLTHLLIERMRDAGSDAGTGPAADVLVRRSPAQLSLVMPRLDGAVRAAERAGRLRALMDEPVSDTERGSAMKVELGVALFDTDPIPSRGMLSLAQARAFATQ